MLPDALFWKVHMYGIMVALGVLAAFGVLYLYSKKMKIDLSFTDFLFYDGIVSVLLGFGCAALFQGVYNYIENPAAGFSLKGGITFLGGMLGGAAVFIGVYLLLRRRLKGRLVSTEYGFPALSVLPCCVLIGHSLGRVGCFFAGCCYGKPTDSWLGVPSRYTRLSSMRRRSCSSCSPSARICCSRSSSVTT